MQRKNSAYLKFIRSLPCLICNNPHTECHHVRDREYIPEEFRGGMGLKSYDIVCLPLCRKHHMQVHEHKTLIDNPGYEIIRMLVRYIDEIVT
jgi:hypothetical protein